MLTVSGLADEAMWKNLDPEQALASSGLGENDLGVAFSCMGLTGPTSLWVQLMSLGASLGRARPYAVSQLDGTPYQNLIKPVKTGVRVTILNVFPMLISFDNL